MNTFYSIVSLSSSSHLGERINIGLICLDEKQVFFHYSKAKLSVVGSLFSSSAQDLAKSALTSVQQAAKDNAIQNERLLFDEEDKKSSHFSIAYLNYLNRYNNNLIQFSEPEPIQVTLNKEIFERLFQKFIFDTETFDAPKKPRINNKTTAEYKSFLHQVSPFVNTNFRLSRDIIPDLIMPQQVDMIGKNGAYNIAHKIDFNTGGKTLTDNLNAFMHLAWITNQNSAKESKRFILGNEPAPNSENHNLWKHVRDSKLIEYVPFDEREQILDHFQRTGVKPIVTQD